MNEFTTITDLEAWLAAHGIDVRSWGKGGTKTVENLWAEIGAGESQLKTDPPRRLVEVTQVLIFRNSKILIEVSQQFADGQRRLRNSPPSEKMQPRETHLAAARRCLAEELGVTREESVILPDTHRRRIREQTSTSYPGLVTRYILHRVEARAPTLPDEPFSTREMAGWPGDPVSVHFWEWKPIRDKAARERSGSET